MNRKTYIAVSFVLAVIMLYSGAMGTLALSTAQAKDKPELRDDCTLDVIYSSAGKSFPEQEIKLYHIANITENAQYELCGNFTDYPVTVTGTASQSEWNEMTITLSSYILADGVAPDGTAVTDANGTAKFSHLTAGMYLVSSVRTENDGKYYVFESFLVAVPGIDESGNWLYNVCAKPKMSENTPSKGEVTYKVVKSWKDNGNKNRPDKVTIEIYKNNALTATIALNGDCGWMYTWKSIDDGSVWTVVEKNVSQNYKVEIQRNGDTFNVTNVCYSDEDSPQTGDTSNVYLYFIIMVIAGIALIVLGITQRKNRHAE